MGGKIFEGTRPVNRHDVEDVISSIHNFRKSYNAVTEIIGSWNNRRARGVEEMGDLDLLIKYQPYGGLWGPNLNQQPDAASLAFQLFDHAEGLEVRADGKDAAFVKRNGIQIDVHFTIDDQIFSWIKKATTVPHTDTYKPLYRNEVLFQLARYYDVEDVVLRSDGSPASYTRPRYTLWEGAMTSTYSFTPKAKTPTKTADKYDRYVKFEDFLVDKCKLAKSTADNPTFMNVLNDASKDSKNWSRLQLDLVAAFTKKNVPIPDILK
jgi:hypothetical protein